MALPVLSVPAPSVAIVWFRRDLRVEDNAALVAALHAAHLVVPVFIWAPKEEGQFQPGRCLRWWLHNSLGRFQAQLAALGSRLIIRRTDDSASALADLVAETGAQSVFFNHLYDPISLVRDHEVKQKLGAQGVCVRSFNADLLYEPWEVVDPNDRPFTSFKAFWDRVLAMPYPPALPLPAPSSLPPVPTCLPGLSVDEVGFFLSAEESTASEALGFQWQPGMDGALLRLNAFLEARLRGYAANRAKVDRGSSSELSPWIHSGTISVRTIYYRVRQQQQEWLLSGEDRTKSCLDFLQQMGYREYGRYLSFHFPFIHERALLAHLRAVPWRIDQRGFKAWKMGMTGYPLVDAGMKQLWSTGWIHNRLRVVCGTFLVKNLLLPWQWGLKHYWDAFLDADLESDALGWQYVAGCMADAHPFSDMLDIDKEALHFDPDGEYVRRWLPVLSRLPTQYIHAPFRAPPELLEAADVELGFNYPLPIISTQESEQHMAAAVLAIQMCAAADAGGDRQQPFRPATEPSPEVVDAVQRLRESQTANGKVPPVPQGALNGTRRMPPEQQRRKDQQEQYRRQQHRRQQQERWAEEAAADTHPDGQSSASEGQEEEEDKGHQHGHRHKRQRREGQQEPPPQQQQQQQQEQEEEEEEGGDVEQSPRGEGQHEQHERRQRRRERRRAVEHARNEGGDGGGIESEEVVSNAPAGSLAQGTEASDVRSVARRRPVDMQRRRGCAEGVHQVPCMSDAVPAAEVASRSNPCRVPSAACPNPGSAVAQGSTGTITAELGSKGEANAEPNDADPGASYAPGQHHAEHHASAGVRRTRVRQTAEAGEGPASGGGSDAGEAETSQEVQCPDAKARRTAGPACGISNIGAGGSVCGSPADVVGEATPAAPDAALGGPAAVVADAEAGAGPAGCAPEAAEGLMPLPAESVQPVQQAATGSLPGHEREAGELPIDEAQE